MSPGAFLATPLFSPLAKARLALEPLIARQPADQEEVIAHFVRRRLGREFLDYAIEPFVAGIYAGDPERLSVPAAFPKLHALEQRYGSLILGAILGARERRKRAETAKNTAKSFSFANGMQTLTDALAKGAGQVTLGAKVVSLTRLPEGSFSVVFDKDGETITRHARAVVLAVPAGEAARLAYPLAPDATRALQAIEYPPVTVVVNAYRREDVTHALGGFGFLAPRVEGRNVLGTLFSSSMFEGRAPAGQVLLTNFVGGRRNPELAAADEETIVEKVAAEHRALARHPRAGPVERRHALAARHPAVRAGSPGTHREARRGREGRAGTEVLRQLPRRRLRGRLHRERARDRRVAGRLAAGVRDGQSA